jgi:hypothetical protein
LTFKGTSLGTLFLIVMIYLTKYKSEQTKRKFPLKGKSQQQYILHLVV